MSYKWREKLFALLEVIQTVEKLVIKLTFVLFIQIYYKEINKLLFTKMDENAEEMNFSSDIDFDLSVEDDVGQEHNVNSDIDLDSSLEDHDVLSSEEVLKSMEQIWLNEKFAPEILPHRLEVVECLYLQIEAMEKNLEGLEKDDIRKLIHELELSRIKYLLSSYLRTRLLKIENFVVSVLSQEEIRNNNGQHVYLSPSESVFATTYNNLMEKFLRDKLSFISGYVADDFKENGIKPNLNSFVFFQAKKAVDGVIADDTTNSDVVDIQEGSKMIMSYNSIINLLRDGDVSLI